MICYSGVLLIDLPFEWNWSFKKNAGFCEQIRILANIQSNYWHFYVSASSYQKTTPKRFLPEASTAKTSIFNIIFSLPGLEVIPSTKK